MWTGATLASQGGATVGTSESFGGFGRGDPGGSTGELSSSLPSVVWNELTWAAPPASENDDMNVAAVVPAEDACLVEAGILFPAQPVGTQSITVRDGTLSPTDPAGILFSVTLSNRPPWV